MKIEKEKKKRTFVKKRTTVSHTDPYLLPTAVKLSELSQEYLSSIFFEQRAARRRRDSPGYGARRKIEENSHGPAVLFPPPSPSRSSGDRVIFQDIEIYATCYFFIFSPAKLKTTSESLGSRRKKKRTEKPRYFFCSFSKQPAEVFFFIN